MAVREAAFVTGAGRGIGRAVARALAREGLAVAVVARTRSEVDAVAAEIVRDLDGTPALGIPCDVTDAAAVREAVARAERELGLIRVLVNNAGAAESAPFLKTGHDLWTRMFRVNVDSAFHCCQAVLPGMVDRGRGRIVNVASIAARRGYPYIAAYVAAKHALLGLTRSIAAEFAAKGITANAVCPGYVDTPMTDRSVENMVRKTGKTAAEVRAILAGSTPQQRIFAPEEVADIVVRLASDAWRGVNGQAINLDGGELQS